MFSVLLGSTCLAAPDHRVEPLLPEVPELHPQAQKGCRKGQGKGAMHDFHAGIGGPDVVAQEPS